jgi:hypothetical protein
MTIEEACLEALDAMASIEALDDDLKQKRKQFVDLQKKIVVAAVKHTETDYFEAAGRVWQIVDGGEGRVAVVLDRSPAPEIGSESFEKKAS